MATYIDKDALVAEIDDWRDKIMKGILIIPLEGHKRADATFEYEILGLVRDFIDTLGVKEVDLEKELVDYHNDNFNPCNDGTLLSNETGAELAWYDYECIAKHFFELGLQIAQKGE